MSASLAADEPTSAPIKARFDSPETVDSDTIDSENSDSSKRIIKRPAYKPPKSARKLKTAEFVGVDEVLEYELGKLAVDNEQVFIIPIKNKSKQEIRIKDVDLSCGCLNVLTNGLVIPPGKEIEMYFRARPTESGPFGKRATINFEGGKRITMAFLAKARRLFWLESPNFAFGFTQTKSEVLIVRSSFDDPPTRIESEDPLFQVVEQRNLGNRIEFRLRVNPLQLNNERREFVVPISVCSLTGCDRITANITNVEVFEFKKSPVVGRRRGDQILSTVIIGGFEMHNKRLTCNVVGRPDLDVTLNGKTNDVGTYAIFSVEVTPVSESEEALELEWTQADRVVGRLPVEIAN